MSAEGRCISLGAGREGNAVSTPGSWEGCLGTGLWLRVISRRGEQPWKSCRCWGARVNSAHAVCPLLLGSHLRSPNNRSWGVCSNPGLILNLGWDADCSGSRLLCPGGTGDSPASSRCPGVQSPLLCGISYMSPLQPSEGKTRTPGALPCTQQQLAPCWPQSQPTFIPPRGQEAGPAVSIP